MKPEAEDLAGEDAEEFIRAKSEQIALGSDVGENKGDAVGNFSVEVEGKKLLDGVEGEKAMGTKGGWSSDNVWPEVEVKKLEEEKSYWDTVM